MPTTYAHYRFGRDVYKRLPKQAQDIIRSHGGLYNIGLHGPDLLFYYKVYKKNPVSQTGFAMHELPATEFFEHAAGIMQKRYLKHALKTDFSFLTASKYAYLFGFLCHFALDSSCHPYVERMVRETGISHSEIEAELDRDLMIRDGIDPMVCRPTSHLRPKAFYGGIIARFFPGVSPGQIVTAIRSMRFCCNLLAPSGQKLRSVILRFLKGTPLPATVREMIIKEHPNPACAPITRELERRYLSAIDNGAELIVNFMDHVENGTPLDKRLEHTFGEH
ncbi:MAG: zinc dependent phospholipase C family protein [Hungatella sp.]|nr:zinc dependent phospholipase C family protein [Hungatella sp.]